MEKNKGATLTQIAKEAGVSVGLVSRLFRGDRSLKISEGKQEEILNVRNRLGGVRVTGIGRKRSLGLSNHIIWPVCRTWVPVEFPSSELYRCFELTMAQKGFRVSAHFYEEENRQEFIRDMVNSPDYCDGLFITGYLPGISMLDKETADLLLETQFPHVSLDTNEERLGVNTVWMHALNGLREAVSHLLELGHRQIGYVGPRLYRYPLFVAAITEAGLPFQEENLCITGAVDSRLPLREYRKTVEESFSRWFNDHSTIRSFICHNDDIAFGVIEVLRRLGLVPGRDVSLVGFDNIEERNLPKSDHPILTTIDNPRDRIGKRAAEVLLKQIVDNQREIVHEHIPVKLIIRETTGPAPNNV